MLAAQRRTPGVYVTELSAFPPSVVGVETAVPAFIGYTETAVQNGAPVHMKPIPIGSLAEFEETFGKDYVAIFEMAEVVTPAPAGTTPAAPDVMIGGKAYTITQNKTKPKFYLYNSIRLFYANGGGHCYVVSVGTYKDSTGADTAVSDQDLSQGLDAIHDQVGPTMLVVPDALLIPADTSGTPAVAATPPVSTKYNGIVVKMLKQCEALGDRVSILDVYGAETFAPSNRDAVISNFRTGVGSEALSYGMSYFPWLHTSVIDSKEMTLGNFDLADATTLTALQTGLKAEVKSLYGTSQQATDLTTAIGTIASPAPAAPTGVDPPSAAYTAWVALNKNLAAHVPGLNQVFGVLADKLSVLPPSGAMAGIYTYVDATRGVWNAPANISLTGVIAPTFKIAGDMQDDLNVPIDGKAVNAIRDFVGRGTLVWGARTLDGNSNDYRYVQVRRTLVYIEQSVKAALQPFVFAANDANTWVSVTAMISNFLTGLWTQGGLMGAKASEAFTVQCGLGSTMTGLDVLQGYMRVQVTLQMIHPAEFIELTFTQKMQGVG